MITAIGLIMLLAGCGLVLYGMSKIPSENRWRRGRQLEGMRIILAGIIVVGIGIWLLW